MSTKTVYLSLDEWNDKLKFFSGEGYWINQPKNGNSTFTIQGQGYHTKFINIEKCREFTLPNGYSDLYLAGQAARKTLEHFYIYGYQARKGYRDRRKKPPNWVIEFCEDTEGSYFDFVSAYWFIARRISLDSLYPDSLHVKSNMPLNEPLDWLYNWKEARNALVGLTYSNSNLRWFNDGLKRRVKKIYTDNKFSLFFFLNHH